MSRLTFPVLRNFLNVLSDVGTRPANWVNVIFLSSMCSSIFRTASELPTLTGIRPGRYSAGSRLECRLSWLCRLFSFSTALAFGSAGLFPSMAEFGTSTRLISPFTGYSPVSLDGGWLSREIHELGFPALCSWIYSYSFKSACDFHQKTSALTDCPNWLAK